jgi:hypothetical protein
MDEKFFSSQIPPAWLAFPYLKNYINKSFTGYNLSESIDLSSWSYDYRDKILEYINHHKKQTNIEYRINSHGYREQEYATSYHNYDSLILAFGHSTVFGVGVKNEYSWPRLLETRLHNTRVLNFGIPGASADTVSRMISCTVPYFHSLAKKLKVITLWPQEERREIFQKGYSGSWSPWRQPPYPEFILSIDEMSNKYNTEKNKFIVETVCKLYNVDSCTMSFDLYQQCCVNDLDPDQQGHRLMYLSILGDIQ